MVRPTGFLAVVVAAATWLHLPGIENSLPYHVSSRVVWEHTATSRFSGNPIVGMDGTIYVGSTDANLYAFSRAGTIRWTVQTSDVVCKNGAPALSRDGNTVYAGSDDGYLYATDAASGKLLWKFNPGLGAIRGSLVVGAVTGSIYFRTHPGSDTDQPNAGSVLPNGTLGSFVYTGFTLGIFGSVAVAPDETRVYLTVYDAVDTWGPYIYQLRALAANHTDGTLAFPDVTMFDAVPSVDMKPSGPVVDNNGTIYFGAGSFSHLYAVSHKTGEILWTASTGEFQSTMTKMPVLANNTIVVPTQDGLYGSYSLYGFDKATGKPLWDRAIAVQSDLCASANGTVYCYGADYGDGDGVPVAVAVRAHDGQSLGNGEAPGTSQSMSFTVRPALTSSAVTVAGVVVYYFDTLSELSLSSQESTGSGLSGAAIAGIVIGAIIGMVGMVGTGFFMFKKMQMRARSSIGDPLLTDPDEPVADASAPQPPPPQPPPRHAHS